MEEQLLELQQVPGRLRRVRRAVGVGVVLQRRVEERRDHEERDEPEQRHAATSRDAGVFRQADSGAVARLVMGPILLFAMRKHILGAKDKISTTARAEAHLDLLFEGLAVR